MQGRRALYVAVLVILIAVSAPHKSYGVSPNETSERTRKIDELMRTLYARGQFNGAVLVGGADGVLYQAAFGLADKSTSAKFTPETESCLASVSKPFTALAVMMLVHDGLMRPDDPIAHYVDGLKAPVGAVTVRQLLTHTAGVPDYSDLNVEHPGIGSAEVIKALRTVDHLEFPAGERYRYSNSGYVLLGAAVERAAGVPLPEFLQKRILGPAGMKRTFVLTNAKQKTASVARGYDDFGNPDDTNEFVTGDGGMYSSVGDLYLFDRAMYTDSLVPQAMLNEAFTPAAVRVGTTTYGVGWNIEDTGQGKRVWHTGNTAGFRAYIERRLSEHRVVIMLTNVGNSKRVEIAAAIQHILDGEPFTYPKRPGAVALYRTYRASGIEASLAAYRRMKGEAAGDYDLSESELNMLGYQVLYRDRKPADAIRIFALNAQEHAGSSNAFDSLAEAYMVSGDRTAARENYEKALRLDPGNEHARTGLGQMK